MAAREEDVTVPDVFAPAKLGPATLPNRIIKAATSEGRSPDGKVTQALIDFHRGFIEGGVGMTTIAYCAVSPAGYSAPGQILMSRENLPGLKKFTDAMHEAGGAASAQLAHAGPVAVKQITGAQPVAPSKFRNPSSFALCREITREEMQEVISQHVEAAEVAIDAGFDAIELHFGHDYLISAFFSPWMNKREDEYSGPIENRTRFAREVLLAVKERVQDRIAISLKMTMDDGIRGSIWLDDATQTARILDETGAADAIELTMGGSVYHQMYLFRGDTPIDDFAATQKGLNKLGVKMFGRRMLGEYPYRHLYMFESARQFQPVVKNAELILLGGINDYEHIHTAMQHGFSFVAMGRALLREPDLVNRMKADPETQGLCIHCNKCMPTVYGTTHCVFEKDYATTSKELVA